MRLDESCPLKYIFLFHKSFWGTILLGSLIFLHILQVEELTSFVPDYLLKKVCIVSSLGKMCVTLWSKGQACSLSSIKDLAFLRSGSHPLMQPMGVAWAYLCCPCGTCGKEDCCRNAGPLAPAIAMSNNLSFFSVLGSCFLPPASMRLVDELMALYVG